MEIYNQNLNKHKLEIEKILANNISNLDHEIISFHEKERVFKEVTEGFSFNLIDLEQMLIKKIKL